MSSAVKIPPQGGSPRDVAVAVNQAIDGKLSCVGTVAATNATTLVVADSLVSADSAIFIVPTTTIARDATVSASNEQITITFQANPGTQTITYIVIG